jgi:hypothetical protein
MGTKTTTRQTTIHENFERLINGKTQCASNSKLLSATQRARSDEPIAIQTEKSCVPRTN